MTLEAPRAPLPLPDVVALAAPVDLAARAAALGVTLASDTVLQLGSYLALLLAMNEAVNLTAITEPAEAWSRHILDALSVLPELASLKEGARVLDVGSGGGVPGIPIAIARPDLRVTMLDATEKKVAFLRAVIERLGLENAEAVRGRAEELAKPPLAASFDAVTARAVAKISALLPWTAPFAKRGGRLVLIKGERAPIELAEAHKPLRRFRATHERTVTTPTGRVVVLTIG